MERFNNWMTYSFDDEPPLGAKPGPQSTFRLHFKQGHQYKRMSYYDALAYNTRMIKDNYSEPFDVLLSGGIDSEVVVRMFKREGVRQNVYTVRLENDLNIQDVSSAEQICRDADVKLNIIDWNLKKFIDSGAALELLNRTWSYIPGRMVRHAWFDLLDNIPVMGEGEPYWRRELLPDYSLPENHGRPADYSVKSAWHLHWVEDYFTGSIYANTVGRTVIGEWYNYTPEIVMSFHHLPVIKRLLNDELVGKHSCWSSRTEIHRHLWPSIVDRPKLQGYEGSGPPSNRPSWFSQFYLDHVQNKISNQGYRFTVEELENIFK